MNEKILECHSISKKYSSVEAVKNLDFHLNQHEFLAILGPSGCGKSTALRMIAGFELPDSGEISLQGKTASTPKYQLAPHERHVGMVFQDISLFPHLSVADNITFGLNFKAEKKKQRLEQMLELTGLQGLGDKMPHMISGGEQQRVAVARALAPSPKIILLDEPFSSLDYQLRVQLRVDIHHILRQEDVSAILVTHDQEEAFLFADRMLVFNQGKIIQEGLPDEIYHHPATAWVASFVGEANFLPYSIGKAFLHSGVSNEAVFQNKNPDEVQYMIRPEDVNVEVSSSTAAHGVICDVAFSGDQQILKIKLDAENQIQARVPSRKTFSKDDHVKLDIQYGLLFPK